MNKKEAIGKINQIGKAGSVISTIAQVLLILGLVVSIIGFVIVLGLPKDLFTFTIDPIGTARINGVSLEGQDIDTGIQNSFTNLDVYLNLGFSVDFTTIMVVLLLVALTYIFKYGAILQTESDETL